MNYKENYRIEADSFPTFFTKIKNENDRPENEEKREDKTRLLEAQKQKLEVNIEAISTCSQKEKAQLEQKIMELELSESRLKEDLQQVRQDFSRHKDKSQDQNERYLFLESQIDYLSKENKRILEQHKIDKENWELQIESFKKGGKTEDSVKLNLLLGKAESKISSLISEIEELKSKNEYEKKNYQQKLDYVQGEVLKLKQEEEKYIRELESRNKDNEEIIQQLNRKIKEIENRIEGKTEKKTVFSRKAERNSLEKSLSVSEQLSKSSKSPLTVSPRNKPPHSNNTSSSSYKYLESSKNVKKRPPSRDPSTEKKAISRDSSTEKKVVSRDSSAEKKAISRDSSAEKKPPVRIYNKAPSYLRKENHSNNIEKLEKEIAVLTGRYKYLLQMSQEASELQSLKAEITKVSNEIEEKSNQLFALKKKQKEFLMQQVSH